MPIINFDEHFADYTSAWMKEHQGEYATYDEMEADLPKVYMMFLNTRAAWLGSLTPGSYFTQFEDPKVLVDWMHEYCRQGVPVPDLLTEQITFVGKPCEKRLVELLKDPEAGEEAKMLAIGLLREMGSTLPKMLYINWQLDRDEKDEMKDNALDSLREMGETAVQPMLQAVREANAAGQEALLDVLSNYPGNEQIFQLAIRLFRDHSPGVSEPEAEWCTIRAGQIFILAVRMFPYVRIGENILSGRHATRAASVHPLLPEG
jgi:hypothetical protein